jgi:DNA-binding transcriptional LysR family regulator
MMSFRTATQSDSVLRILFDSGAIFQWEFNTPDAHGTTFRVEPQGSLITNDDDTMIRAALQGAGMVQHLDIAVRTPLADGSLIRVLQSWCKPFAGFYLYVPSREHMPPKVRALMDFMIEKREPLIAERLKRDDVL